MRKLKPEDRLQTIGVSLPRQVLAELKSRALLNNRSVSYIAAELIRLEIEKTKGKEVSAERRKTLADLEAAKAKIKAKP